MIVGTFVVCFIRNPPLATVLPAWAEWSQWSDCSCYNRRQMRRRYCKVNQPRIAGFCLGALVEYRECTDKNPSCCESVFVWVFYAKIVAPIAGGWTEWSSWSQCSHDCGTSGERVRARMCAAPVPANQGQYCYGQSFERSICEGVRPLCDRESCLST